MSKIKVLAIGTSSNRNSINLKLAATAAGLIAGAEVEVISAADYEMPLYSDEREAELGQPEPAREFMARIAEADAVVTSFAEYNGSYTASFKNLFDWASRINIKVFQNKPVVFLSTSPGGGGAKSVLAQALQSAHFFGADVVASLSIPKYYENFDDRLTRLTNDELLESLQAAMNELRDEVVVRREEEQKRVKRLSEKSARNGERVDLCQA